MAPKASGGAGGAHLASGYISLNVKYGGAMRQIADDFGVINKRAKETGDSITKGLVEKADTAKAKVKELAAEYESQRQKVAALRAEVTKLGAAHEQVAAKERALQQLNTQDGERNLRYRQEGVTLQLELNQLMSAATRDSAALTAWNQKYTESMTRRKAELKEISTAEKALADARKKASPESLAEEATKRKKVNDEIARGRSLFEQYGKAVEDANRKQQLAKTSAEALSKSVGSQSLFSRLGHTLAHALSAPFGEEGRKAGKSFSTNLNQSLGQGSSESQHKVRSMASGLFMGMTPGVMGAAGVGLALGKAFGAGFNREETINTVKLRLEAMGRSAAEVNQVVSQATTSVEGTQYSLAESLTAASTAMSAGIQLGPQMTQYLNNIANAAGLTGEEFGVVADSINRVQMQGTVSLENIEPLIKKDMPILKWLKEYYQKQFPATTQQDITDMISKKMIPADVLQKVLTANLNDGMKGLTRNTVKGALRDMFTQVGKVTQSILQPFMGDWPTFINSMGDKLKRFAEYIKPGMAAAAEWIKKTWNDVWPKVTGAIGKAIGFIGGLWQKVKPGLSAVVGWMIAKWRELWPQIGPLVSKVVGWISAKWNEIWPVIKKFAVMVRETWVKMWPQLQEKFGPFMAAFKRLWDALAPIVGPAVKAVAGLFAWLTKEFIKHLPAFAQFGTNIVNWLSTAIDWMRNDAWPWMQKAWRNVSEWIGDAITTVGRWKDNVVNAFNDIKAKIEPIWTWLEEKWKWLDGLSMPEWAKWLIDKGSALFSGGGPGGINLSSYSTPLAGGAGSNVPMPARLRDSGHVSSGPQSRHTAGLLLSMFPGIQGDISGSYLPKSEGGPSMPGTHDAGLSIDIPIGQSADQRSMGDQIEKFLQENAKQLGIVYTIWKDTGRQTGVNPDRPAGTTFTSGGHQDHIDVMFDGKSFGDAFATSLGSNGVTYNVAPTSMSTPLGGNGLEAMFASAGIDPSLFPMLRGFAKAEGNNPSGVPTLGFTDGQAGTSLQGHVDALARQLINRQSFAGQFPAGGTPEEQAAWMAKVVGQTGNPSDWQGNAQPPVADYISRIVEGMGPRRVDASAFGGVNNASITMPLAPDVTFGPPIPSQDWIGGEGKFDTSVAGGGGGGGSWGDEGPSFLDRVRGWLGKVRDSTPLGRAAASGDFSAESLLGLGGIKDAWKNVQEAAVGGAMLPLSQTGGVPTHVGNGFPTANDYYKKLYPRGDKGGPDGSKRNPLTVTDPQVGKNTDPANQPKPGEPHAGSGAAPGAAPHAGTGAAPGPGSTPSPGGSGTQPGDGQAYKDLATGLGGVASTAFSDQFAGTPFSDPSQWPATKSAGAVLSFFGNLLSGGGGSAGGGLVGMLMGGGAGGKGATPRQLRDAQKGIKRLQDDVAKQQAEVNSMVGKPQYELNPQLMQDERDKLRDMQEDLGDKQEDYATLQGKGQGGGGGPFANLLSHWGIPQPAAAGSDGFTPQAYGNVGIGSPAPAPGVMGPDVMSPGSANIAPALLNAIPSANNPASLAPGQPNSQPGANIDMSINQQVSTPGITEAQNAARRAQNTQYNSPLLNMTRGVLV